MRVARVSITSPRTRRAGARSARYTAITASGIIAKAAANGTLFEIPTESKTTLPMNCELAPPASSGVT